MADVYFVDAHSGTENADWARQAKLIIEVKGIGWNLAWGPGSDFASYELDVSGEGGPSELFGCLSLSNLKAILVGLRVGLIRAEFDMEWPEMPPGGPDTADDAEVTATTYYGPSGAIIHKEVIVYT